MEISQQVAEVSTEDMSTNFPEVYTDTDYLAILTNNVVYQSMADTMELVKKTNLLQKEDLLVYEEIKKLRLSEATALDKVYSLITFLQQPDDKRKMAKLVGYFANLKSFSDISQSARYLQKWCNDILFKYYINEFQRTRDTRQLQENISSLDYKPIKIIPKTNFAEISKEDLKSMVSSTDVIPSCMPAINQTNDFGGYIKGSVVTVAGAPGCLVGSTQIRLRNTIVSMEEIYKNQEKYKDGGRYLLWTVNPITKRVFSVHCPEIQLTKYTDETMEIVFDMQDVNSIECTTDHQFLCCIKTKDLLIKNTPTWFTATHIKECLDKGLEVLFYGYASSIRGCKSGYSEMTKETAPIIPVKSVTLKKYDEPIPVYDMVNCGSFENFSISIGRSYMVTAHNSGKSNFLMYEVFNMCMVHKKRGFWLALGDLMEVDFIARFGAIYWGVPKSDIISNIDLYYTPEFREALGKRLDFSIIEPGKLSVEEFKESMLEELQRVKDNFYDFVVVDYDANFSNLEGNESMYQAHATIYQELVSLAKAGNKCLVFIASQVKNEYQYNVDIIPANGLAESSKKQNIIDMLITITRTSLPENLIRNDGNAEIDKISAMVNQSAAYSVIKDKPGVTSFGYIHKAKERRGSTVAIPYVSSSYSYTPITVNEYNELKKIK